MIFYVRLSHVASLTVQGYQFLCGRVGSGAVRSSCRSAVQQRFLVVALLQATYVKGVSDLISLNNVKLTKDIGLIAMSKLGICSGLQNNGLGFLN